MPHHSNIPPFIFGMSMDGWRKIADASKYAGVSPRTFRGWIKNGLRHIRLPSGTILTKPEWIDRYLNQYEVTEKMSQKVDQVVEEILGDF